MIALRLFYCLNIRLIMAQFSSTLTLNVQPEFARLYVKNVYFKIVKIGYLSFRIYL